MKSQIVQNGITTGTAALPTGQGGSIVVILIISFSILIAGVGASLRVKLAP